MNKKRWWMGFGLGVIVALFAVVVALLRPMHTEVVPVLWFLGAFLAGYVCHYTNFGYGRKEYGYTRSDVSGAYTNKYLAVNVPPYPFVGGVTSGYSAVFWLAFAGLLVYTLGWGKSLF